MAEELKLIERKSFGLEFQMKAAMEKTDLFFLGGYFPVQTSHSFQVTFIPTIYG